MFSPHIRPRQSGCFTHGSPTDPQVDSLLKERAQKTMDKEERDADTALWLCPYYLVFVFFFLRCFFNMPFQARFSSLAAINWSRVSKPFTTVRNSPVSPLRYVLVMLYLVRQHRCFPWRISFLLRNIVIGTPFGTYWQIILGSLCARYAHAIGSCLQFNSS